MPPSSSRLQAHKSGLSRLGEGRSFVAADAYYIQRSEAPGVARGAEESVLDAVREDVLIEALKNTG